MNTQASRSGAGKPPLLNRQLKWFMAAMVLANLGGNMYEPLLPLYLRDLNANVLQVGLFFTLSQMVPLALQILGGWLSDSLGRLRCIAVGSVAGVLSYVGLLLAPSWQWVLVGQGLAAVTRALVAPSFGAFIAEQSTEANRSKVYGISETIFNLVSILGPPMGGFLAQHYGFKPMILCAGIFYLCATIIRISMARTAARGEEAKPLGLSFSGLKSNLSSMMGLIFAGGLITWMLITDGVRDISFSMSFTLMPVYLQDIAHISVQNIGFLQSMFGIAMMVTTFPAGWLGDRFGERKVICLGFVIEFTSWMLFLNAKTYWGFAASWLVAGFGVGLMSPTYQSLISKAIPNQVRGTAFGLMQTSLGIFSLPAPAIGAQLWERYSPRLPYIITAVVSLLAIFPVWFKFRLTDKERAMTASLQSAAPEKTV